MPAIKKIDKRTAAQWATDKSSIVAEYPTTTRITDVPIDGRYGAVKYGRTVLGPVVSKGKIIFGPDFDSASVNSSGVLEIGGLAAANNLVTFDPSTGILEFHI